MEKNEYLAARLKRDFIRFSMLQEPRFTDREVSARLKSTMNVDRIQDALKHEIELLILRKLSIERLREDKDSPLPNTLPQWLTPDLANQIVEEYREVIKSKFSKEQFLPALIHHVEKLVWAQGVDDMSHNLKVFLDMAATTAKLYREMPRPCPDEFDLEKKYQDALHISIRERITKTNHEDILRFRTALIAYTQDLCEIEMYNALAELYQEVADTPELTKLVTAYQNTEMEAKEALTVLDSIPAEEEWDKEYDKLVPCAFYKKNVEAIDDSLAFRMILMLRLSKHEEYLREEGYLTPSGELRIFTSPRFDGRRWLDIDFAKILGI